ncbi:MAG: phenylalanine--tRNA ligase subunit beta [Xanthomonadales bacterium]|nr:phenylalanine--tRNA ligase subunit beta [Xanthomonadales bacterium]
MRFSCQWLKQWVDLELSPTELAERLTASGLEVDGIEPVAAPFSGVVVGEILSCEPHPDADKLKLCKVSAGEGEPLQVVCGAPNAVAGLKMPFARVGAVLGEDFTIRKAKLRGVASHGMACSARELGLSDDHSGLMELPADAPVGKDFREFLGLDDHAITLDLTPNRADCLSIRGIARDVSASCGVEYTPLEIEPVPARIDDQLAIRLDDPEGCARYAGRVIRGIDPAANTPLWMVEALRRCGIRSISAVVDITNYVMLELGQPMHAFDLDRLEGGITVRPGAAGEQLVLLDEKEVELDEGLVTICDDSGPVALGGIMGGLSTAVTDQTQNVFLESAWFRPAAIAGKARALGMHTDASHRFERGVDPRGQELAVERMTALLIEIAGGEPGPLTVVEAQAHLPVARPVQLRLARLNRVLGSRIEAGEVSDILQRLGMQASFENDAWTVTAPSARFDIAIEEDLIEEVARIHGYDALPATLPGGELRLPALPETRVGIGLLRESLCAAGYQEAINYSFVDKELLQRLHLDEQALPLANPISSDMNVMRTSLLPGLLMSLERNLRRQHERVRLFETGVVFLQDDALLEVDRLAGVVCGNAWPEQWGSGARPVDYYDVRNDLEQLLALRGSDDYRFSPAARPWLHPGQSAAITVAGAPAGWLGALHPGVLAALDIKVPVLAFELDIDVISKRELQSMKIISRFPSVRRDLAFLLPESVKYDEVKECVQNIAGESLKDLLIFDVFSGHNVEKGYKSIAIGLILQDVSCTLTDEVVDALMQRIISALESRLDAQHRG